jgi:hypothetical protein
MDELYYIQYLRLYVSRRILRGCRIGKLGVKDKKLSMDSLTNRWLVTLGIGTVLFGISLFVLRIPIRTIFVFFALGVPVVFLWLYIDLKSRRQDEFSKMQNQKCICAVCKHDQAAICIDQKCPCCVAVKGDRIVGHSINPLQ